MKYDAILAKAELERYAVIIRHHIRQARANGDNVTAKYFRRKLIELAEDARKAMK